MPTFPRCHGAVAEVWYPFLMVGAQHRQTVDWVWAPVALPPAPLIERSHWAPAAMELPALSGSLLKEELEAPLLQLPESGSAPGALDPRPSAV